VFEIIANCDKQYCVDNHSAICIMVSVSKTKSKFNCALCDTLPFISECSHSSRERWRTAEKATAPQPFNIGINELTSFARPPKVKHVKTGKAKRSAKSLSVILAKVSDLANRSETCTNSRDAKKLQKQIQHNERKVSAMVHNAQTDLRLPDYKAYENYGRGTTTRGLDYVHTVKYLYCADCKVWNDKLQAHTPVFSKARSKALHKYGKCTCGSTNIREYSGFKRKHRIA